MTVRSRVRDWLGTQIPRRFFSRLPQVIGRIPVSGAERALALTFDDGPHPIGTPALLEVLRDLDVSATFFLLGERAQQWPELVGEILTAGHSIGNHSWAHADFWKCTKTRVLTELTRCQSLLENLSGGPVPWVRPPYGHVTWTVRAWAKRKGAKVVLWDLLPPDYNPASDLPRLKSVYQRNVRPGSIVCLHDNDVSRNVTPQLLRELIPAAKAEGWIFQRLGSLQPPKVSQ